MPRLALIDGGELAFKAALGNSTSVDWDGDGNKSLAVVPVSEAIDAARKLIGEWQRAVRADGVRVAMSKGHNFRKRIDPTYKAHHTEKPANHAEVEAFLRAEYRVMEETGLEADDILGLHSRSDKAEIWIVSSDKDMLTIPHARLYRPHRASKQRVTPERADFHWLFQALAGDTSDGYKGCPRIGEVKAEAILARAGFDFRARWVAVVETFVAAGLSEDDAIRQARLARILRPGDLADGRIRLWHPTRTVQLEQDECETAIPAGTTPPPPSASPVSAALTSPAASSSRTGSPTASAKRPPGAPSGNASTTPSATAVRRRRPASA